MTAAPESRTTASPHGPLPTPRRAPRCAARAGLLAVVAAGVLAPPASAGPLVAEAANCEPVPLSQPFLRWADPAKYALAPNGGLEDGRRSWALEGGAAPTLGSEPFAVLSEDDRRSLSLPPGSRARTTAVCVGLGEPTLRFFARGTDGFLSALLVEVLFEDAEGDVHALPVGVDIGGGWHPTMIFPIQANLLPLLPGDQTPVAFRFTPLGSGDWRLDNVFYDPWVMR
jgi:hypothetical protein